MFKYIKEWYKDYQTAMNELQDSGWFVFYHSHGSVCHYVEPEKTTHINTADDKTRTISKNNKKS
jgi:hypothetical protein